MWYHQKSIGQNNGTITYLGNRLKIAVWLQVIDTMALGFTVGTTFVYGILATTTTYADAVDDEALFGLEAETTCLVGTRWTWRTMQLGKLTILPDTDAEQVAHHVALLLAVQLLNVAIGSHDD